MVYSFKKIPELSDSDWEPPPVSSLTPTRPPKEKAKGNRSFGARQPGKPVNALNASPAHSPKSGLTDRKERKRKRKDNPVKTVTMKDGTIMILSSDEDDVYVTVPSPTRQPNRRLKQAKLHARGPGPHVQLTRTLNALDPLSLDVLQKYVNAEAKRILGLPEETPAAMLQPLSSDYVEDLPKHLLVTPLYFQRATDQLRAAGYLTSCGDSVAKAGESSLPTVLAFSHSAPPATPTSCRFPSVEPPPVPSSSSPSTSPERTGTNNGDSSLVTPGATNRGPRRKEAYIPYIPPIGTKARAVWEVTTRNKPRGSVFFKDLT